MTSTGLENPCHSESSPCRLPLDKVRSAYHTSKQAVLACQVAEEETEAGRRGCGLPGQRAGGSWPHQLVHRPVTLREEPAALTTCLLHPPWEPCRGDPRREWSTPSIPPAHPLHPPNSPVMYKTFPETTYSSCIFHEARPKLKYINIKIPRSTSKKRKKKGHVS